MGVNIFILDKNLQDHPTWDSDRLGGDKENAHLLAHNSTQYHSGKSVYEDPYFLLRPVEGLELVGERGEELLKILEDPKWWVYLSY